MEQTTNKKPYIIHYQVTINGKETFDIRYIEYCNNQQDACFFAGMHFAEIYCFRVPGMQMDNPKLVSVREASDWEVKMGKSISGLRKK